MISLKIHCEFDLLGDNFLCPYCEVIDDIINGHARYMDILTSILSVDHTLLTHFVLILYLKIG